MNAVFWVRDYGPKNPHMRHVLATLASRGMDGRAVFPSYARLADDTGYSRRHVIRLVNRLIKEKWLTCQKRTFKVGESGRGQRCNLYSIAMFAVKDVDQGDAKGHQGALLPCSASDKRSCQVVTEAPSGGVRASPERKMGEIYNPVERKRGHTCPRSMIDYSKISPLVINGVGDIYDAEDVVRAAISVTGDRSITGWGYWLKLRAYTVERLGKDAAEQIFRDALAELWSEMRCDPITKPSAILNNKLKASFRQHGCPVPTPLPGKGKAR